MQSGAEPEQAPAPPAAAPTEEQPAAPAQDAPPADGQSFSFLQSDTGIAVLLPLNTFIHLEGFASCNFMQCIHFHKKNKWVNKSIEIQ